MNRFAKTKTNPLKRLTAAFLAVTVVASAVITTSFNTQAVEYKGYESLPGIETIKQEKDASGLPFYILELTPPTTNLTDFTGSIGYYVGGQEPFRDAYLQELNGASKVDRQNISNTYRDNLYNAGLLAKNYDHKVEDKDIAEQDPESKPFVSYTAEDYEEFFAWEDNLVEDTIPENAYLLELNNEENIEYLEADNIVFELDEESGSFIRLVSYSIANVDEAKFWQNTHHFVLDTDDEFTQHLASAAADSTVPVYYYNPTFSQISEDLGTIDPDTNTLVGSGDLEQLYIGDSDTVAEYANKAVYAVQNNTEYEAYKSSDDYNKLTDSEKENFEKKYAAIPSERTYIGTFGEDSFSIDYESRLYADYYIVTTSGTPSTSITGDNRYLAIPYSEVSGVPYFGSYENGYILEGSTVVTTDEPAADAVISEYVDGSLTSEVEYFSEAVLGYRYVGSGAGNYEIKNVAADETAEATTVYYSEIYVKDSFTNNEWFLTEVLDLQADTAGVPVQDIDIVVNSITPDELTDDLLAYYADLIVISAGFELKPLDDETPYDGLAYNDTTDLPEGFVEKLVTNADSYLVADTPILLDSTAVVAADTRMEELVEALLAKDGDDSNVLDTFVEESLYVYSSKNGSDDDDDDVDDDEVPDYFMNSDTYNPVHLVNGEFKSEVIEIEELYESDTQPLYDIVKEMELQNSNREVTDISIPLLPFYASEEDDTVFDKIRVPEGIRHILNYQYSDSSYDKKEKYNVLAIQPGVYNSSQSGVADQLDLNRFVEWLGYTSGSDEAIIFLGYDINISDERNPTDEEKAAETAAIAALGSDKKGTAKYESEAVTITNMPIHEFVGVTDDISEVYDLIYVGSDISSYKLDDDKRNYLDDDMDGLIYTNIGDKVSSGTVGLIGNINLDYRTTIKSITSTASLSGLYASSTSKVPGALTYFDVNVDEDGNSLPLSFYNFEATSSTDTRLAATDLSVPKYEELLEYAELGLPVVISDELVDNSNTTDGSFIRTDRVDVYSKVYQFLDAITSYESGTYGAEENFTGLRELDAQKSIATTVFLESDLTDDENEDVFFRHVNKSKPEIIFLNSDGSSVDEGEIPTGKPEEYIGWGEESENIVQHEVNGINYDLYRHTNGTELYMKDGKYYYVETDIARNPGWSNAGINPVMDTDAQWDSSLIKNNSLEYVFTIENPTDPSPATTSYTAKLFYDRNANGLFNTDEQLQNLTITDLAGNQVSENELKADVTYRVTRVMPEAFTGAIPWELQVIQNGVNAASSEQGLTYIKPETPTEINVLHIIAQPISGGAHGDKLVLNSNTYLLPVKVTGNEKIVSVAESTTEGMVDLTYKDKVEDSETISVSFKGTVIRNSENEITHFCQEFEYDISGNSATIPTESYIDTNTINQSYYYGNYLEDEINQLRDNGLYDIKIDTVTNHLLNYHASSTTGAFYEDMAALEEYYKQYDMIFFGYGDYPGRYDTSYRGLGFEATQALVNRIDDGQSLLLFHDMISFNTGNPFYSDAYGATGYTHSVMLADAVSIDRYGMLDVEYGLSDYMEPQFRKAIVDNSNLLDSEKIAANAYDTSLTYATGLAYRDYNTNYITDGYNGASAEDIQAIEDKGYDIAYEPSASTGEVALKNNEGEFVGYGLDNPEYSPYTQGYSTLQQTRYSIIDNNNHNSPYYGGEDGNGSSDLAYSVSQVNRGQITSYPYNINTDDFIIEEEDKFNTDNSANEVGAGEVVQVDRTHQQYFQLNMNKEDIIVWYTLAPENTSGRAKISYTAMERDVTNNYYIYTSGNVTYTGATCYGSLSKEHERELFINTMIASYRPQPEPLDIEATDYLGRSATDYSIPVALEATGEDASDWKGSIIQGDSATETGTKRSQEHAIFFKIDAVDIAGVDYEMINFSAYYDDSNGRDDLVSGELVSQIFDEGSTDKLTVYKIPLGSNPADAIPFDFSTVGSVVNGSEVVLDLDATYMFYLSTDALTEFQELDGRTLDLYLKISSKMTDGDETEGELDEIKADEFIVEVRIHKLTLLDLA